MSYVDGDWAMDRLNGLMTADFSRVPNRSYFLPEPAYSVYLAFDAGEFQIHDAADGVEHVTKPELRRIFAGA